LVSKIAFVILSKGKCRAAERYEDILGQNKVYNILPLQNDEIKLLGYMYPSSRNYYPWNERIGLNSLVREGCHWETIKILSMP